MQQPHPHNCLLLYPTNLKPYRQISCLGSLFRGPGRLRGGVRDWIVWLWFRSHVSLACLTRLRALSLPGQILVYLGLINTVGLTFMTPWDPSPPQSYTGTRWWQLALIYSRNFAESPQTKHWHGFETICVNLVSTTCSFLPCDSLETYLMQLAYCQRFFDCS